MGLSLSTLAFAMAMQQENPHMNGDMCTIHDQAHMQGFVSTPKAYSYCTDNEANAS